AQAASAHSPPQPRAPQPAERACAPNFAYGRSPTRVARAGPRLPTSPAFGPLTRVRLPLIRSSTLMLFDAVGEIRERLRNLAHRDDRFVANLRHHRIVDVPAGLAQFHLDQLHRLFKTLADAARPWPRWWRRWRIRAHGILPHCKSAALPTARQSHKPREWLNVPRRATSGAALHSRRFERSTTSLTARLANGCTQK